MNKKEALATKPNKDSCIIRRCENCRPHEFQDRKYGLQMRVMNFKVKSNTYVCTVCGKAG